MSLTAEEKLDEIYGKTWEKKSFRPGERKKLVEEMNTDLENLSRQMQNDLVAWQKKYAVFFAKALELYKILNKPDVLYDDSPLAARTLHRWLRLFMLKKGMAFMVKDTFWFDGENTIPEFYAKVKEIKNWTLRFAQDDAPVQAGIDKILKQEVTNG